MTPATRAVWQPSPTAEDMARLLVWNRRLMIAMMTCVLFGASMMALAAAGPQARAMAAGEGMLIVETR